MPTGIIINSLSVVIGGLLGSVFGEKLTESFRENLTMIFGLASMGMGISSVVLMKNMPAVIFALILGTSLGFMIRLGEHINRAALGMQKLMGNSDRPEMLVTAIVLFCASGTGIYGAIVSGMSGDHSILIAKSLLDFFTAMIFACTLKKTVCLVALPQFAVMILLFFLAGVILPLTDEAMISDFKACGGLIMIATGFRIINVKMYPTADMIPAMILVMPLSFLWMTYIIPLVS